MTVLIICDPADVHVSAIAWALGRYGTQAVLWRPAPPWVKTGSVFLDSTSVNYRFPADGGDIAPSAIDAVWMRRWPKPVFPAGFREDDKTASRNELLAYHRGLLELLPTDILWANRFAAGRAADFKLNQLAAAGAVGLALPKTLVTDDAALARTFVASRPGQVIYKPFFSFHWEQSDKEIHSTVTIPIRESDLEIPEALVWSPGIFQEFVPKAYELRVSVFGRTCVAAKIYDQDPIDWRTRQHDMKVAPYCLPEGVERKIQALMDKLGIVMGMLDFIVTPDGDYIFLEVNEQGQFLWVEDMCPEIPVLDIAARFLASGDPGFRTEVNLGSGLTCKQYMAEGIAGFIADEERFRDLGGNERQNILKNYDDRTENKIGAQQSQNVGLW